MRGAIRDKGERSARFETNYTSYILQASVVITASLRKWDSDRNTDWHVSLPRGVLQYARSNTQWLHCYRTPPDHAEQIRRPSRTRSAGVNPRSDAACAAATEAAAAALDTRSIPTSEPCAHHLSINLKGKNQGKEREWRTTTQWDVHEISSTAPRDFHEISSMPNTPSPSYHGGVGIAHWRWLDVSLDYIQTGRLGLLPDPPPLDSEYLRDGVIYCPDFELLPFPFWQQQSADLAQLHPQILVSMLYRVPISYLQKSSSWAPRNTTHAPCNLDIPIWPSNPKGQLDLIQSFRSMSLQIIDWPLALNHRISSSILVPGLREAFRTSLDAYLSRLEIFISLLRKANGGRLAPAFLCLQLPAPRKHGISFWNALTLREAGLATRNSMHSDYSADAPSDMHARSASMGTSNASIGEEIMFQHQDAGLYGGGASGTRQTTTCIPDFLGSSEPELECRAKLLQPLYVGRRSVGEGAYSVTTVCTHCGRQNILLLSENLSPTRYRPYLRLVAPSDLRTSFLSRSYLMATAFDPNTCMHTVVVISLFPHAGSSNPAPCPSSIALVTRWLAPLTRRRQALDIPSSSDPAPRSPEQMQLIDEKLSKVVIGRPRVLTGFRFRQRKPDCGSMPLLNVAMSIFSPDFNRLENAGDNFAETSCGGN
ncbi:hypothetical protein B0H11DRAFT_1921948 [Mycena galericulata]|nr:hypothetical protein B0H11DRAFT_1921948 [Mycena galericulata]